MAEGGRVACGYTISSCVREPGSPVASKVADAPLAAAGAAFHLDAGDGNQVPRRSGAIGYHDRLAGWRRRAHTAYRRPPGPHQCSIMRAFFAVALPVASAWTLGAAPAHTDATAAASRCSTAAAAVSFSRCSTPAMNIGDRFVRLVKSNANDMMNKMEDPEKVLEQAVQDMQKDLVKVRQAYAEVSASTKRMEEQVRLAEAEGAKWYERAQLALTKGEDELAREALTRRKQQLEMSDSLKEQIEGQQGSITSLYESMKQLEAKMAEAKAKKDQIIARARTAKAATKVNDMLAGVGTSSSTAAFDRMADKVEQLESEAAVSKQLAAGTPSGASSSMEAQFAALESADAVDDELAAMKKAQGVLPSSPVDDELEQMRKSMEEKKDDGK